ncbi:hypothetical protein [Flavobacterium hydatis]|uniref:Lipoprotein n=1 Tax=Flavobacterium hydatis TaxID=991 RepID=A0A085ZE88_FLAHY|nr:hypothetical protein [Flavobacterium hydatis]KFF02752.1 hypothetical protein IW20_25165 [Flavobacterium hydatis]OXA95265.1 hypothetical protein B0A62_08110 [Flavobacterium hydatis]
MIYKYYCILLICLLLFNCQNSNQLQEDKNEALIIKNNDLSKDAFLKCTTAKDTVFKNGDYVRFIPINTNKSYGIEIKLNGIIDTLDYYSFDCNSHNGMIPKLLFKEDYIALSQGSSSNYRYLIICNLDKKIGEIDVNKFEIEIVENSGEEILFFKKDYDIFLFSEKGRKLFFRKLPSEFINLKVKRFELYRDKVIIIFEQESSLVYKINEFQPFKYGEQ